MRQMNRYPLPLAVLLLLAVGGGWGCGRWRYDELTSLAVDSCGRVFVGGYTRGALVNGQANLGGEDMFILDAAL
jgi:hypothetical protein